MSAPGTLMICISDDSLCGVCEPDYSIPGFGRGSVARVAVVHPDGLEFVGMPGDVWCACAWRPLNDGEPDQGLIALIRGEVMA